jgi:biopolymer transport protein TolR
MGANISQSGSSSGKSYSVPTTLAEINVTPLVDVMLVLLIVFMISAPLMQQGISVDLPKANAGAMNETPEQLVLTISKQKQIHIADHVIPTGTLFSKLEAIVEAKPQTEIVIQADDGVNYGFVAQVMAEVKRAGIHRVGLATEPDAKQQHL